MTSWVTVPEDGDSGKETFNRSVATLVRSRQEKAIILDDSSQKAYSSLEPDSLESQSMNEEDLDSSSGVGLSLAQQVSMSTSSMSGVSLETVIEKDLKVPEGEPCRTPDSDSFEMVEKPDLIDDFIVVEEVAKEVAEFDTEGKCIFFYIKFLPITHLIKYKTDFR